MAARVAAFVVALVVAGAPVLTTVCHATCAARDADASAPPPGHHSCHHTSPPSSGAGLAGNTNNCSHSDGDDQIGGDRTVTFAPVATAALTIVALAEPAAAPDRMAHGRPEHRPPGTPTLRSQLRI